MSLRRRALPRAQKSLQLSQPIALEKRRAMLGYDALQELEQQFQVPISGTAASAAGYASTTLSFEVEFFDAPEQRDSSLSVPLFTFGAVVDPGTLMISAVVNGWVSDSRGAITGAVVTIGVCTPGVSAAIAYEGHVAFSFQGYGAISENVPTLDVGT